MSIKVGDVFRWKYKNRLGDNTLMYWCKDQKAVAIDDGSENPDLVDIFWGGILKDRVGCNDYLVPLNDVELEFLCNLNEVRIIHEYETRDYDNVYNLSNQEGCVRCLLLTRMLNLVTLQYLRNTKKTWKKLNQRSEVQSTRLNGWSIESRRLNSEKHQRTN